MLVSTTTSFTDRDQVGAVGKRNLPVCAIVALPT